MKKVKYTGRYHSGPSVCYKGVQFVKGEYSEVSDEWFEANKNKNLVEAKPKAKKAVKNGDSQDIS